MNKSYYFSELATAYDAELQDLLSDFEGNSALKVRLAEKRQELKGILPMIEFCPEMVVPVFYDGFRFIDPPALARVVACEPGDDDFPGWDEMTSLLTLESWACPYSAAVLAEPAGEAFMVTAACLEFIRKFDTAPALAVAGGDEARREGGDEDEIDDDHDLAEAGDDWLGEQGFDSLKS